MKDLVSMNEAVERGYGSRSKLSRLVREKRITAVRNGRLIFFRQEDLDGLYQPAYPTPDECFQYLAGELSRKASMLTAEGKAKLVEMLSE